MTEVGWATIGGIVSVVVAAVLKWGLSRGVDKQAKEMDVYKQLDQAWDEIRELKEEVDVERTARIAMELENLSLKKKILLLEGAANK